MYKIYLNIKDKHPVLYQFCRKIKREYKRVIHGIITSYHLHQGAKIERSRITLVISRYNENVSWLKNIDYPYFVYNKGKNNLPSFLNNVHPLSNLGRESGTYLDFIVNNYYTLPEYVVFLQGYPTDHASNLFKKLNEFDGIKGFLDLSDHMVECDVRGFPDSTLLIDMTTTINILFNEKINNFTYGRGAQFLVDRKTILSHSLKTYNEIYNHCKKARINIDGLSDKFSPWILERTWPILFRDKKQTVFDKKINL